MNKIICVAGKMAAGKNTACKLLEKRGWVSIDADLLGHKAAAENEEKIIAAFAPYAKAKGIDITGTDGHLNRRALGTLLFSDKKLLAEHESIVYPAIEKAVRTVIEQNKSKNIVINAAVLYKIPGLMRLCSLIIFIDAPLILRLLRAGSRDKMKFALIMRRFIAQKNMLSSYKLTGVPILRINNSSSVKKLEEKILGAGL
ncbi:MAG: dephospho-CoA kinase [Treponema sp.]